MSGGWNAALYDGAHGFVAEFGRALVPLLGARAGERILDVGCGTGQLTAEIAAAGASVVGLDFSQAMVDAARAKYPGLEFVAGNVCEMEYAAEFDGVFSNAALHWVKPPEVAVRAMARALRPGGRFVAELGGHGNVAGALEAAYEALRRLVIAEPEARNPWYYPSVGEYAGLLEANGIEVTLAVLFDRPTPLAEGEAGLERWFQMFGGALTAGLGAEELLEFGRIVRECAAPRLWREGVWVADYRRLRVVGQKTGAARA